MLHYYFVKLMELVGWNMRPGMVNGMTEKPVSYVASIKQAQKEKREFRKR